MRARYKSSLALVSLLLAAACDGGGGSEPVDVRPTVTTPIPDQYFVQGRVVEFDVSQSGTTFTHPEGAALSYSVGSLPPGLRSTGGRISGAPTEVGTSTVVVLARDSQGNTGHTSFAMTIDENRPPRVVRPNAYQFVTPGSTIEYEATEAGTVFVDDNGDPLVYEVTLLSAPRGLSVLGTWITGTFDSVGLVRVKLTATDPSGAVAEHEFGIVAPAPEPGVPSLPEQPYIYADEELPLPLSFAISSRGFLPFADTTPIDNRITNEIATLGRVLFYDKRLSITNTVACGSCHKQARGFAGAERFSPGFQGELTRRRAMPLTNVRYNYRNMYFSDMRVRTLEALALIPIEDPIELGQPLALLEAKLAATETYPPLFEAAFGDGHIDRERIARALAQFLRSLISYQSRFDLAFHDWSNGTPDVYRVFAQEELLGLEVYSLHCRACHGAGVHAMREPSNNGLDAVIVDPGVHAGSFRSASLRNIEVSGPYMHDGRFATLREVIDHYDSGVQMNPGLHSSLTTLLEDGTWGPKRLNLSEGEKDALEAFLGTLTDPAFLSDPKFSDPFE